MTDTDNMHETERKSMQNEKISIDNEIGDLLYQSTEVETQMDISIRWNRNVSTRYNVISQFIMDNWFVAFVSINERKTCQSKCPL